MSDLYITKEMHNDFLKHCGTFWRFDDVVSDIKKFGEIKIYDNITRFNQTVVPLLGINCRVGNDSIYFKKQIDSKWHLFYKIPIRAFYDATELYTNTSDVSIYLKTTHLAAFIRFGGLVRIDNTYYNDSNSLYELLSKKNKENNK